MNEARKVLLIGGGGTLGAYTAEELLRMNCQVDVICLEDNQPAREGLCFYQGGATLDYLTAFLKERHYDGIINYLHYPNAEDYKPVYRLLSASAGRVVFLSSYRIYADRAHPITENAPILYDVLQGVDEDFLQKEKYAVSKSQGEKFLREECGGGRWIIVRPVISFSRHRFDLVTRSGHEIPDAVRQGKRLSLPNICRDRTAGLDWAGNSGKLIARLLFQPQALGEAFTISSAQNWTWGQVAEAYAELTGLQVDWVDTEDYLRDDPKLQRDPWILKYDRLFNRVIDNTKVLQATGLSRADFVSIKEGIRIELEKYAKES